MQGYGSTTRIQIALSFNTYVTLETETDKERKKERKLSMLWLSREQQW